MANLVENNLIISGEDAVALVTKIHEEGMEYFIPMPKYLLEDFLLETARTPSPAWSEWAYEFWGTKWDIYKEQRELTVYAPNCAELFFLTANASVEPFCWFLSEHYPNLRFELFFREEGDEQFTKREWRST